MTMSTSGDRRSAPATKQEDEGFEKRMRAAVDELLGRRPAVGLAVGVIRAGRLELLRCHGVADLGSGAPITEDTVFRIASITKLFTAVAVMQLWERGLIDLDAPAADRLRSYPLLPARPSFRRVTVRHLLTHTSGIPDVIALADLAHPDWGPFDARPAALSVGLGEELPELSDYYRPGLRVRSEPGTGFVYSNHGFATLGQIVEDVSGVPLEAHLRERLFEPLGMTHTELVRSPRLESRLATGHVLGRGGPRAIADRHWVTRGASNIYSTPRDMARFVTALLGDDSQVQGPILARSTLATMFEAHHRPDPRLPGMGLGFFRHEVGGHLVVGHDGILPGFTSEMLLAPDDGAGVMAFTNGAAGAAFWMPFEAERLLQEVLGVPQAGGQAGVPQRPDVWPDICGVYRPRAMDVRGRMVLGGGVRIVAGAGGLRLGLRSPVPVLRRGFALHPDDDGDPYVFRLDLSEHGMRSPRVVFVHRPGTGATSLHTDFGLLSFDRVAARTASPPAPAALGLLAATVAAAALRRRTRARP
jgi:CubicO group peptidase (beta-lactamase class C family)